MSVPAPASLELQTQSYIDIQYLATFGLYKINALEYFYTSPFFDAESNNERLRKQGVHPQEHLAILQTMTGLEFVLDEHNTCEPNLFVFRKQKRWSPKRADLIDVYYCTDGIIYQCADFLSLLKTRAAKTSFYLNRSFDLIHSGVRWTDSSSSIATAGVGSRKRKSGFVCWKTENDNADAAAKLEPSNTQTELDLFHVRARARNRAGKKYERLVRDLPTFKAVLEDVRLPR